MTEFSVVWNNDITPQQAGIKESPTWKRPVYFIKTAYNSMDFRYNLPKESKAQIFFSIDDDVTIECSELVRGFEFWKSHAIGDIAPLMGYAVRGFDTVLEKSQFKYTDPKTKGDFFLLILIGIAWVPRHFFEIYNSNSFWELEEMRKIVQ